MASAPPRTAARISSVRARGAALRARLGSGVSSVAIAPGLCLHGPRPERWQFPITAIREIKILKILNHKNIVRLKEIVTSKATEYNQGKGSIYMVMEFCEHDLTGLTDAGQRFTTAQIKCYMKQLLEGMAYCHKNRVLHRDIKGSNLLINDEGQLKLADFGLARPFEEQLRPYTNRVITLWYRPPELLLGASLYGPTIDMWSVGCIFAELLLRKPILPGRDEFEQLTLIFRLLGTPTEATWPGVTKLSYYDMLCGKNAKQYANRFDDKFKELEPLAQNLLRKLLCMDPTKRISAKEALDHDYFWTEPLPAKPHELPKYPPSHEFTAKKKRQQAHLAAAQQAQAQAAQLAQQQATHGYAQQQARMAAGHQRPPAHVHHGGYVHAAKRQRDVPGGYDSYGNKQHQMPPGCRGAPEGQPQYPVRSGIPGGGGGGGYHRAAGGRPPVQPPYAYKAPGGSSSHQNAGWQR